MTVSFHFMMDDNAIENKGTFVEAFANVVNEMLSEEEKNVISISVDDPENDSEDEEGANCVNLNLSDTNNNQYIDRYHDIFKMFMSIIRRPDGSFPYIP
ncbi:MAG: hypothetical protein J5614_05540 [Paludibacteraceae bacterium]|nr:hypothetical protein [Paludibacteraceae bacterium]